MQMNKNRSYGMMCMVCIWPAPPSCCCLGWGSCPLCGAVWFYFSLQPDFSHLSLLACRMAFAYALSYVSWFWLNTRRTSAA